MEQQVLNLETIFGGQCALAIDVGVCTTKNLIS